MSDAERLGLREALARAEQRSVAEPSKQDGTHDVHTLIIGHSITGLDAF